MNKQVVVFSLVMFSLISFAGAAAPSVSADWLLDRSGTLVQVDGAVLGDDDNDEVEDRDEDEDRGAMATPTTTSAADNEEIRKLEEQDSRQREAEKKRLEKSRELLKKQTELRLKNQSTTNRKSNVEISSQDGKFKLRQEIKDDQGRLIKSQEIELKDGESLHVEQEGGEPVEINSVKDGELELRRAKIKTNSEFNLKVGDKNEITVALPNGKVKEIALPDKALENLISNGIIAPQTATGSADNAYQLIAGKNGEPVYEVEGEVEKKVLGIFKMKFAQKLAVAATSSEDGTVAPGDIVESETREISPWRRLLERLAR
jgi:hypothetical protein